MLDVSLFCERNPLLYHVAAAGAWPQIQRHGLLSTSAIFELFSTDPEEQAEMALKRHRESIRLEDTEHGLITIRDQSPLHLKKLGNALNDMTTDEWCRLLNSKVFFWARKKSCHSLLTARQYRNDEQTIIEISSARFFAVHHSSIEVADINTGNLLYKPVQRGRQTSPHRVSDITRFVERVIRRHPNGQEDMIYTS